MFSAVSVLSVVAAFFLLVFFHELGHFLAAKLFNVKVEQFALGFGPRIFSRQIGETLYSLRCVPVGGFVQMHGEDMDAQDCPDSCDERSFANKSPLRRVVIVAAGPLFNIIMAFVILCVIALAGHPASISKIKAVVPGGAAAAAGMLAGDEIVTVDGRDGRFLEDVVKALDASAGHAMTFVVKRASGTASVIVTPKREVHTNVFGEPETSGLIGVAATGEVAIKSATIGTFVQEGWSLTGEMMMVTAKGVRGLLFGNIPAKEIGGPIAIAQMTSDQAQRGIAPFFFLVAFLCVNLGIMNLLPVPVLDGGHIVLFLAEAITGSRASVKVQLVAQRVGMAMLLALMITAVFNDVQRLLHPLAPTATTTERQAK